MPSNDTFLIDNGIVLPLEGDRVRYDPGAVLVVDGTIVAVGTHEWSNSADRRR